MNLMMALMLVSQVALLWVVFAILQELRCLRGIVAGPRRDAVTPSDDDTLLGLQAAAYAIWCWRGKSWELDLGSIPAAHEAGKCPAFSGTFVGQRVKTECTRR